MALGKRKITFLPKTDLRVNYAAGRMNTGMAALMVRRGISEKFK
jgi:hypothetical protein